MSTQKRYLFRPSSAPAILLCACYEPHEQEQDDEDTDLGKQVHAYIEDLVQGKVPVKGKTMEQEHVECCEHASSQIIRIFKKFIPDFDIKEVEVEKRRSIVADNLELITECTPDVSCRDVMVDIKGCFDFDIENHYHKPQVQCYSFAQMRDHGYKTIHAAEVYVMPKKERLYDVTFNEGAALIESIMARITDPMKREQPCEYCKWCKHLMTCRVLNERLLTVQANFAEVKDFFEKVQSLTDPKQMSVVLNFAKILEERLKVVKDAAKKMSDEHAHDEDYIPGFVRTGRSGDTEISDLNKAFQLSGLTQQMFMNACSISIPKLAEEYRQAHMPISLDNAKKEIRGRLNDVILPVNKSYYLRATKKVNKAAF
jgi:hypothetical protein